MTVTILPQQALKIWQLAEELGVAIRITQKGSVLELDFGPMVKHMHIDAQGNELTYKRKRS